MGPPSAQVAAGDPRTAGYQLVPGVPVFSGESVYGWLSLEWAGGWVIKGEASLGYDKTNNNVEDLLRVRHETMFYAPNVGVLSLFVCVARALNRRAAFSLHVDVMSSARTVLARVGMRSPMFRSYIFWRARRNV